MTNSLPYPLNQHGFCPNHSTVSTLLPLAHKIAQGFNQPRPPLCTLTKTNDLTKAFDMVNHTKLIRALTLSSSSNNTKRWLTAYLKGRTAGCWYNFTLSSFFHARVGVPQGIVHPLSYLTSSSPYSLNLTTFSPAPMLMTSLFPVPTPILIRRLRPFLSTDQILRSGQMSGVWLFLLQNPPSLYSPLNLHNLTYILQSLWTTPYCPWKGLPAYWDDLRSSLQNQCLC